MGNQFKTAALLAALSGLLIAIGYYVIGGPMGLIIGIGFAAVTNLVFVVSVRQNCFSSLPRPTCN